MDHRIRSDEELLSLARRGSDAAFAVLVRRCVDDVDAVVRGAASPLDETVAVFRTAMRELAHGAPDGDVRRWFVELAEARAAATTTDEPADPEGSAPAAGRTAASSRPAGEQVDVDAVWSQLAPLWPDGNRRREVRPLAIWAVTVLVTIALSAGIPWFVLGRGPSTMHVDELRAFPIQVGQPEPEPEEPEIEEPSLPVFEFPVPPEDLEEPDEAPDPDADDEPADDTGEDADDETDGDGADDPEGEPSEEADDDDGQAS